ncbi:DUF3343 domain-containing protein [uncultured Rikenella sp.]|uniref:DUF3343 domain-containing protein n=1 Tax=uncultured Rikenella sp. TaxID=368003 RepID=UPI00260AC97E|nr:DUF3343 domain-containing protein [uncultured Rikenella sp.]
MIVLFRNAREVIRADAAASRAGLEHRVKPVPEEYSTECGMCLYVNDTQAEPFKELMSANGIEATYHEEK